MERSPLFFSFRIRRPMAGYTVSDLLITLAVAGILLSLSATTGLTLVLSNQQTTRVNALVADLALARSEAIKRSGTVTICQSSTGVDCTRGNTWHQGWIVFSDPDDSQTVNPGEQVLRVRQAFGSGSILFDGSLSADHYVRYEATGLGWPNGTFTFCDMRGAQGAKSVVLNRIGRPRTSNKKANGRDPLNCP